METEENDHKIKHEKQKKIIFHYNNISSTTTA